MCTSLHRVTITCLLSVLGASVLSVSIFGASSRPFVVGEVHCTGTETEVLECSHNSIGDHFCGGFIEDADDVAIGCGMLLSLHPTNTHTHTTPMLLTADCKSLNGIRFLEACVHVEISY